ncbi:MAG: MBL fold metallo-hydrolase [Liquorilactobacillus mali]|uniref:MBL fold metallo-hydrolase n=1 Tax=Liquorilactobacillus mali TaxID=1618 RepID=UPI0039EBB4BA
MTNIRFLNGLNTIGANIAEISTRSSRVITDFGMAVDFKIGTSQSLIEKHVLPDVPELFGDKQEQIKEYKDEAIFITHLHLDHTSALAYLKSDIPVYLSRPSYKLYRSLVKQGLGLALNVNFKIFDFEVPVKIGDLTVTAYQSDHDILGAAAFLIEDGKHAFGQSGDVRLSGSHRSAVDKWMNLFKQRNLDLLMLEATSFSFEDDNSLNGQGDNEVNVESKCLEDFKRILNKHKNLTVINPYSRDIERLLQMNKVANHLNRPIVWEPQYAHVISEFSLEEPIFVLDDGNLGLKGIAGLIPVSLLTIMNNLNHFCLQNSFENLDILMNFNKFIYLHCNGAPLGDYDPHYQTLKSFLENKRIEFIDIGVSGHATKAEICEVARTVAAKKTAFWHSFDPDAAVNALKNSGLQFLRPRYTEIYRFK